MLRDLRTIIFVCLCIISQFFIIIPTSSNSIIIIESIKNQNIKLRLNPSDIIEMIQKVDESKLRTYVQTIQDFGPHPTGSEALDRVGEYIFNELTFSKLPVDYLDWNNKNYTGKNIVATLQGIGETDGVIILCAHYDTIKISPGAEDDGSGVANLLMLAKIMSDYSFNTTIKFIFWFAGIL
jgi:acetylornithine deacetylase/succinyl-diaminopimelate desuccinylase-like protein